MRVHSSIETNYQLTKREKGSTPTLVFLNINIKLFMRKILLLIVISSLSLSVFSQVIQWRGPINVTVILMSRVY